MPRWLGSTSPAMSSTVSGTTPSHRDRKIKLLFPDRPLGPALPADRNVLVWAQWAITMARGGESYNGRTSPWWCDGEQFFETLQAAGPRPVRDLITTLDGCSGPKAGQIAAAFRNTPCRTINRTQAVELLQAARDK